jgi:hypothetical protein
VHFLFWFLYSDNFLTEITDRIMTGYLLDVGGSLTGKVKSSFLHHVHTDSGAQPVAYPMRIVGSFSANKATLASN